MKVWLEFYGPVRDRVGTPPGALEVDTVPTTLEALVNFLANKLKAGDALHDPHLRIAINDQICGKGETLTLKDGDRIAVLSPFSGG